VNFFVECLPALPKRVVEGSVSLLCAFSSLIIACYGIPVFRVSLLALSPGLGLGITKGVEYIAVPLCCTGMGIIYSI
jgi:TRAP-type C4-dicarboxylate transport system permease small subunit